MKTPKCKACGTDISVTAKVCPKCGAKIKKPIHKRWWFWAIIVWLLLGFVTLVASCSILANSLNNLDFEDITYPTIAALDIETTAEPTAASTIAPTTESTEVPTEQPTEAPTEQPTEIVANQLDEYIRMPLSDLMAKIDELGYTATYINQGEDWTEFIEFFVEDYLVGGLEEDPEAKTVVVDLLLKSNAEHDAAEAALREKLETGSAWLAVENYGEAMYGESFELHYFFGKIAEYAEDENSWFLKAECTVSGVDMICEAKVTGTSDNPEVIYFEIY